MIFNAFTALLTFFRNSSIKDTSEFLRVTLVLTTILCLIVGNVYITFVYGIYHICYNGENCQGVFP